MGHIFPIGTKNLIYMIFFAKVRQIGIKGIQISAVPPLIGQERSRNTANTSTTLKQVDRYKA